MQVLFKGEKYMKMKKLVVEAKDFNNVKEIIYNSAQCYAEQTAFVIKHKNAKEIEYENVTYKRKKNSNNWKK